MASITGLLLGLGVRRAIGAAVARRRGRRGRRGRAGGAHAGGGRAGAGGGHAGGGRAGGGRAGGGRAGGGRAGGGRAGGGLRCTLCRNTDRKFGALSSLLQHQADVHPQANFFCDCGERFLSAEVRDVHKHICTATVLRRQM